MDLLGYTLLVDTNIMLKVKKTYKSYNVKLKYGLKRKEDAETICKELNNLINLYLDNKLGAENG